MKKISIKIVSALAGLGLSLAGSVAIAASNSTDFEGFMLGEVHNQDGWTSGHGSSICPLYDVAVVSNTFGYTAFGAKSLRISDAITCGSYNDQTFSKSLTDEAGETAASTSTFSGGARQPYFESQWDFASAQPGSEQVGLSVVASANRGDTMRMSWLQMTDTPTGLKLNFEDYRHAILNFVITPIATGLSRSVPHTVRTTINFIDGPANDIVKVYLDGVLIHTGTTWEDYYRDFAGGIPHSIDSMMFRVAGTAIPAHSGNGFLIDNFSAFSGPAPALTAPPAWNYNAWVDHGVGYAAPAAADAYYPSVIYDTNGFGAGAPKYAMWYSDGLGSVFLVASPDGATWGTPAAVTGITQAHHAQVLYDVNCFGVVPCNAGTTKYRIWFWDMGAPGNPYGIASMATAESADGLSWTNKTSVVQDAAAKLIQSPDTGSGWNRGTYGPISLTYQPTAANAGTDPWNYKYVMYYNGTDGGHEVTGLAYSADGLAWSAYTANPVLSYSGIGGSEAWDCVSAAYGTVFKNSLGYHYFYSGSGQDNGSGGCANSSSFTGIGYAFSLDGKTWVKDSNPIFQIANGVAYRSGRIYTPLVVRDGSGILRMYFSARDVSGPKKIGYATLTEPAILHVIKLMVHGNGGTEISSDFSIHLKNSGVDVSGSPLAGIIAPGTAYALSAGTYVISETANAAYAQSFTGDCSASGSVTLVAGDDKLCTIINTDIPAPGVVLLPNTGSGSSNYFAPLPLINVTKIPDPLALPGGPGSVTYAYTLTNVGAVPMGGVWVKDNLCSDVSFVSGDTNKDGLLDLNESWVYRCTKTVSRTETNTATAHGNANGWDGYDIAVVTVAVAEPGLPNAGISAAGLPIPLIKVVTVPSRLTPFPAGGGSLAYAYTVTNPGAVPLSSVVVNDDRCGLISGPSGDANHNGALDPGEAWTYSCVTHISASMIDVVTVVGRGGGLIALDYALTNVLVAPGSAPALPNTGGALLVSAIVTNLQTGSRGPNVAVLQQFLIAQNKGPAARALANVGATAYFGALTRAALAEFQLAVGISPPLGNFGPITRAYIQSHY